MPVAIVASGHYWAGKRLLSINTMWKLCGEKKPTKNSMWKLCGNQKRQLWKIGDFDNARKRNK